MASIVTVAGEQPVKSETTREAIIRIARAEVGTLEVGENNHGPGPKKYLASVGLGEGYAYCGAGLHWCFRKAGVLLTPEFKFARADYWHINSRRIWGDNAVTDTTTWQMADIVGYYYKSLGRIGHTEFYVSGNKKQIRVIGFNTSSGMDRDGQGVWEKVILKGQATCVSRWLDE